MTEGSITLSHAELDRVSVIRSIISRQLTQAQAAPRLQLSVRQVQRLTRTYRTCGATRMVSTHRGRGPATRLAMWFARRHWHSSGRIILTSGRPCPRETHRSACCPLLGGDPAPVDAQG